MEEQRRETIIINRISGFHIDFKAEDWRRILYPAISLGKIVASLR
jgi:hypothetical protein